MSTPLPERLARIKPLPAFAGALVLVLAGLFLPGIVGGAVLLALVAGLAFLSSLTWRVQPPATRMLRLVILTLLLVIAVGKIIS